MNHRFSCVAVLCAQKKGVYSHSSGVVDQFPGGVSQHGRHSSQLIDRIGQMDQVNSQSAGDSSQLSLELSQSAGIGSQIVEVDLWDKRRNAFKFVGGFPVVAHPPCRLWGSLKGLPKLDVEAAAREKDLGRHCVRMVIKNGGVLEHPASSDLFADMGLPAGGYANEKGFTLELTQRVFGHPMMKPTWFFFAGISYDQILPVRPALHFSPLKQIHHLSAAQREATPPELAKWLLYHAAISEVA